MLLWVNNHYYDFAGDRYMENCLEQFEALLESEVVYKKIFLLILYSNTADFIKSNRESHTSVATQPRNYHPS